MDIKDLLAFAVENNASDLHLSAGLPPMIRVDGELRRIDIPAFDQQAMRDLLYTIMSDKQCHQYEKDLEMDFAYDIVNLARFRVNIYTQNRGIAAAFRVIPTKILTLDELNVPASLTTIAKLPRGLILVTGPTGSGKTTTLAAMLDAINSQSYSHVITIEDPIEFVHTSKRCLINQREVHRDTLGFDNALRSALREDPDVIFVGEMRDLETMRLALTAAETGHLVLGSLHTTSAAKTINRVVDIFPGAEKMMVRTMLSESLQAVIAQNLLKKNGGGRVATHEIMICTPAIRNLIREDKVPQIYSAIQTGQTAGMQTLEQCLRQLINEGVISKEQALDTANNKDILMK